MSTRINNLDGGYATKYPVAMISKDKLPKRPWDQNIDKKTTDRTKIIAMNRDGNKAEIQKASSFIAQSEGAESQENEENNTSDKSTLITAAGALAKEGLYRLTKKGLLKPNPYMVALSLLGVDFEEDGDALKKGAETGKMGDFKNDYNNYFKNMWDNADSVENAAWEGFNLPANVISIGLQDCLQSAGVILSKMFGKDVVTFAGTGVSTVGTTFNAISDIAEDSLKSTYGFYKNLFTGDFDGIGDVAEDLYNGVKDSVVDVANSVTDVVNEGADLLVDSAENIASATEEAANAIGDVAEDIGEGIEDVAEEIGDVFEDGLDEVEDFFDSIF